jgi:isoleucyl-tRNA synthetase
MYRILDAVVRLMAPVMIFTAEEIWQYMPDISGKEKSVHLAALPESKGQLCDETLSKTWERLLAVRREVTKALEVARAEKKIGHPLDAAVTLWCDAALTEFLAPYEGDLRTIFITSLARMAPAEEADAETMATEMNGLSISVTKSTDEKCQRCWIHDASVGDDREHPEICSRCMSALEQGGA